MNDQKNPRVVKTDLVCSHESMTALCALLYAKGGLITVTADQLARFQAVLESNYVFIVRQKTSDDVYRFMLKIEPLEDPSPDQDAEIDLDSVQPISEREQ